MKRLDRDFHILEHIISYCAQIDETIQRFGDNQEIFREDVIYRNAAALCILQIGELVGNLSEDFRAEYTNIPWRQIKAMRNIVAHKYGAIDPDITWEIVKDDIPTLRKYCTSILEQEK